MKSLIIATTMFILMLSGCTGAQKPSNIEDVVRFNNASAKTTHEGDNWEVSADFNTTWFNAVLVDVSADLYLPLDEEGNMLFCLGLVVNDAWQVVPPILDNDNPICLAHFFSEDSTDGTLGLSPEAVADECEVCPESVECDCPKAADIECEEEQQ